MLSKFVANLVTQGREHARWLEAFCSHAHRVDSRARKHNGVSQHLLRERYPASAQLDRLDGDLQQIVQQGWLEVFNIERTDHENYLVSLNQGVNIKSQFPQPLVACALQKV